MTYLFHPEGTTDLCLRAIPILADSEEQAICEANVLRKGGPGELRLFAMLVHKWHATDPRSQSAFACVREDGELQSAISANRKPLSWISEALASSPDLGNKPLMSS